MDFYKLTYGATAAEMLKKAKQNGDHALLADIMKKYGHTDAGAEAIKLLADYHLDRGNSMPALLCYSKLISRQGPEKVPLLVLAKAAWAAHWRRRPRPSQNTIPAGNVYSEKELWRHAPSRTRRCRSANRQSASRIWKSMSPSSIGRTSARTPPTPRLSRHAQSRQSLAGGPAFMRPSRAVNR